MTNINAVEEVNIFKNDGTVIHIPTPKSKPAVLACYTSITDVFSSQSKRPYRRTRTW